MKRLVPAAVVLIVLAVAVFVFLRRAKSHRTAATTIAPAEAVFFVALPDTVRTVRRWPETGLAQLWNQPEMQAFLELPLAKMPLLVRARETFERLVRIVPREAFFAVHSLEGEAPKFVAGLAFSGRQTEVAALVAEPWADWKRAWPAGRAEVLNRGGRKIETYADGPHLLAGCFHAGWYLVANDLAALEAALDRCGGPAEAGLAGSDAYRRAVAALPAELDAILFTQLGAVQTQFAQLLGQPKPAPGAANEAGRALAWGMKLDGAQCRDAIFITGTGAAAVPLARTTLGLTAPETLLYVAFAAPGPVQVPPALQAAFALFAPALAATETALADKRVTWADFGAAFGPEASVVMDWPESADVPAAALAVAVRDAEKARAFLETLTAPAPGGAAWRREEINGAVLYRAVAEARPAAAPGLALTPQFALLSHDATAVRSLLGRLAAGGQDGIASQPAFSTLAAQVGEPTAAFGYLDLRRLFERAYGTFRPFLAMSLALSPVASQHFDGGKLPPTDAIARHLGPSVYAQRATGQGVLLESVGTLTFSQTLAALAAGVWTSAGPALQQLGATATAPKPAAFPTATTPEPPPVAAKAAESSAKPASNAETSQDRPSQP